MQVAQRVTRIVHERLGVPEHVIEPGSSIIDDLGADSLARIDLTLALEEAFEIDIEDEAFTRVRTVGEAIRYVERRIAESRAGEDRSRAVS